MRYVLVVNWKLYLAATLSKTFFDFSIVILSTWKLTRNCNKLIKLSTYPFWTCVIFVRILNLKIRYKLRHIFFSNIQKKKKLNLARKGAKDSLCSQALNILFLAPSIAKLFLNSNTVLIAIKLDIGNIVSWNNLNYNFNGYNITSCNNNNNNNNVD